MPEETIDVFNEKAFEQEVVRSDRLVLIDFWAPWCQPCQMMMPVIERIAEECGNQIKIIKVNISDNEEAAQKFNILGVPTLIIFKGGQEQKRIVGLQNFEQLKKTIQGLL